MPARLAGSNIPSNEKLEGRCLGLYPRELEKTVGIYSQDCGNHSQGAAAHAETR